MAKHTHLGAQINHVLNAFLKTLLLSCSVPLFPMLVGTIFLSQLLSRPQLCTASAPSVKSAARPGISSGKHQGLPDRCICCSRSTPFSNGPGGTGVLSPHKHVTGQKTFINGPCTVRTSLVRRCIIGDTFCFLVWGENMPLSLVSLQRLPPNIKITSELSDHMCVSLSTQSPSGCLFRTLGVLVYFCSPTDKLCVNSSRAEVVQALTKMFWDQLIGKVVSTLTEFSLGR